MANYHHFSAGGGNLRERLKEGEGERASQRECITAADEVEAGEISPKIKSIFPQHENQTTSTVTEGEYITCKGNRFN